MERSRKTHPTFFESDIEDAIAFAKQEFELGSSNDPNSIRAQLLSVHSQTGNLPKELENLVTLPTSCNTAWVWFWDLCSSRSEGFSGSNPITYAEMLAYFQLIGTEPTQHEISLIRRFDIAYLNHQRSKQLKQQK